MNAADKVLELAALIERLAPLRKAGRRVALANGLFDILHVGHLRYLEGAALEADILVVLRTRADLSPASTLSTKAAQGRSVYDALRERAASS